MATARLIGASAYTTGNSGASVFHLGKFTAEATGLISQIRVYSHVSGNVKVAIYADDGGEPGALITANDSGQAVTAAQWNTLTIGATPVSSGTVYWLAAIAETAGNLTISGSAGTTRYKTATYSTFSFPDPAGSGFSSYTSERAYAGFGILVVSPSGIDQPVSLGTAKLTFTIQPSGIDQAIALGTPEVTRASLTINPSGIDQAIVIGTPTLVYPQILSPPGIEVTITIGTASVGIMGRISPTGISQTISIGTPTVTKYRWHVILEAKYQVLTQGVNKAYVIGRDSNGDPVYGQSADTDEIALVGERLEFDLELEVATDDIAEDVAEAILVKRRLATSKGYIVIPPNCGVELWDVVNITDSVANQSGQKYRIAGIRFEYIPRQARFHHEIVLGGL